MSNNLIEKYKSIIVEREGICPNSFMKTESIISEIYPYKYYTILNNKLQLSNENYICDYNKIESKKHIPKHIKIYGIWNDDISLSFSDSNILGNNGLFITKENELIIPIEETTIENLAYYNAKLHKIGDTIEFETNQLLPLTIVDIGDNYIDGYIYPIGNGVYCEKHNTPHYHQPLSHNCGGYLIIGKEIENGLELTAFTIPYGYGIYTPPYTIHNDSFLKGKYLVVYAKSETYSTVLFRNENLQIIQCRIE